MAKAFNYRESKQPTLKSLARYLLFAIATSSLVLAIIASEFVYNQSPSLPKGIYLRVRTKIKRGSIVGACIDGPFAKLALKRGYLDSGNCSSGVRPVIKYVAAVPGDSLEILPEGVLVNGESLPNTAVLFQDQKGRPIPNQIGRHIVQPGEYWLIANHYPGSFDSRYFGPVREILDVVVPFLTETELCKLAIFNNHKRC